MVNRMNKFKKLSLLIISISCITTTNVYSSVPVGSGSITFVGSIVESTCKSSASGLICGKEKALTYTDLTANSHVNNLGQTHTKIQLIDKKRVNKNTLLATIQYH